MWWWKENALLKKHLQDLQSELEKEQGKAARLAGVLGRLQSFGVAPDGQIPERPFAEAVVDIFHALLHAEQALFLVYDPLTLEFAPLAARGFLPQTLSTMRLLSAEDLSSLLTAPLLVQPLHFKAEPLGILAAARPSQKTFSAEDKSLFLLLATQVTLILANQTLFREAKRNRAEIVEALTRTLGARDTYTHRHAKRTKMLARALSNELALPEALIQIFEEGALLHDIGKIGIDDAILKKPGELTPEERQLMRTHARLGKTILESVAALQGIGSIVLYHQEWYNGSGYPEGLAGEEIPLGARVVQILDAWDAMTSDRPYRKAMPKAAAISELRRQAGTQFDPKLVDLFLRLVERFEREGIPTTEQPSAAVLASREA